MTQQIEDISTFIDQVQEFKKEQLDVCIGITFNSKAWEVLKDKFYQVDFTGHVVINGLPCYVLDKQQEECVGWYSKEAMYMWIEAENSDHIDKLPELKSKEST